MEYRATTPYMMSRVPRRFILLLTRLVHIGLAAGHGNFCGLSAAPGPNKA